MLSSSKSSLIFLKYNLHSNIFVTDRPLVGLQAPNFKYVVHSNSRVMSYMNEAFGLTQPALKFACMKFRLVSDKKFWIALCFKKSYFDFFEISPVFYRQYKAKNATPGDVQLRKVRSPHRATNTCSSAWEAPLGRKELKHF